MNLSPPQTKSDKATIKIIVCMSLSPPQMKSDKATIKIIVCMNLSPPQTKSDKATIKIIVCMNLSPLQVEESNKATLRSISSLWYFINNFINIKTQPSIAESKHQTHVFEWCWRWNSCLKRFPQTLHTKSWALECDRICLVRIDLKLNSLLHTGQGRLLTYFDDSCPTFGKFPQLLLFWKDLVPEMPVPRDVLLGTCNESFSIIPPQEGQNSSQLAYNCSLINALGRTWPHNQQEISAAVTS